MVPSPSFDTGLPIRLVKFTLTNMTGNIYLLENIRTQYTATIYLCLNSSSKLVFKWTEAKISINFSVSWDLCEALEKNVILSFFGTDNPFNLFYDICRHSGPDLQVLKRLTYTDLGSKHVWESGLNTLFDWYFNKMHLKMVKAQNVRQN